MTHLSKLSTSSRPQHRGHERFLQPQDCKSAWHSPHHLRLHCLLIWDRHRSQPGSFLLVVEFGRKFSPSSPADLPSEERKVGGNALWCTVCQMGQCSGISATSDFQVKTRLSGFNRLWGDTRVLMTWPKSTTGRVPGCHDQDISQIDLRKCLESSSGNSASSSSQECIFPRRKKEEAEVTGQVR